MELEEREMISVYSDNEEVAKIEIIAQIPSKMDEKKYVIYTLDEQINDTVNINVGIIEEYNGKHYLKTVENDDEIDYVMTLMQDIIKEG